MSPRIQKLKETIASQNSKFVFETSKYSPREPSFLLTNGNTDIGSVGQASFLNTESDEPTGKSLMLNNFDLRIVKSFNPTSDRDRNTT